MCTTCTAPLILTATSTSCTEAASSQSLLSSFHLLSPRRKSRVRYRWSGHTPEVDYVGSEGEGEGRRKEGDRREWEGEGRRKEGERGEGEGEGRRKEGERGEGEGEGEAEGEGRQDDWKEASTTEICE